MLKCFTFICMIKTVNLINNNTNMNYIDVISC